MMKRGYNLVIGSYSRVRLAVPHVCKYFKVYLHKNNWRLKSCNTKIVKTALLPNRLYNFEFFFSFQVSAYHDKFVHLLDKSFIQPVIDWEAGLFGRLTATVSKNNATNVATNTFLMKFEKFVRFILYEIENNMQSYGSLHWWPFSRLCGLCHIDYDFIGE